MKMKKLILLLLILTSVNLFAQSNYKNEYLQSLLKEFPIYKEKIDKLYFEHIGMSNGYAKKHYFDVYSKELVSQAMGVKFNYKNQWVDGRIQYLLIPVVYSTYSPSTITDPNYKRPNVTNAVKCIILSKYGVFVKNLSQLRSN